MKKFPEELKKSFVCYDSSQIYIFAGVFGMTQHSSFLKFALDSMKLNFEKNPNYKNRWFSAKTGPVFFTTMFVSITYIDVSSIFLFINCFSYIFMTPEST